ncbi:MAG: hypothetical protein CSA38_00710 [Flavobacteriales bacterium]|nr:MAG: hypothetical protein CSA38_00710 [Flavobacteriales bacterium]
MFELETIINSLTIGASLIVSLFFFTIKSSNKRNYFLGLFILNSSYLMLCGVIEDLYNVTLLFDGNLFILVFLFLYLISTINSVFKNGIGFYSYLVLLSISSILV